jgi:hypothetical protein
MEPIECTLRVIEEVREKPKYGRYLGTWYNGVPSIGKSKFPVALRIDADFEKYLEEGLGAEEIAMGCVEFLNIIKQPKRGRRKTKSPYGTLEVLFSPIPSWLREKKRDAKRKEARAKFVDDDGDKYLQVIVCTDSRKVKTFAGTALGR